MALESGVIAKIAAAVGLAGISSAGVYYGHSYFTPGKSLLSKYDRALIDFLNKDGLDIAFEVKKAADNNPAFTTSDLVFSTTNPTSVKAKVQVTVPSTETQADAFKGTNAAASLEAIKTNTKTKTPSTWTWSCELEFKREGEGANSITTFPNKERVMGESDKGLFGILKKDSTVSDAGSQLTPAAKKLVKEAKVDFIKRCAAARGTNKNLDLDTKEHSTENSPSTTHTFSFVAGGTGSPTTLVNKEGSDFNDWFKASYATVNYTA